ncbi:hypothetical protein [Erwinia sp. S59]|uniref:hypothetical protein n=1 Tax=Erwinia sp. S59 TaxID=2769340 RepID=UPI0019098505|nr:hypothetical protein [Erwinia sp. S59]MBK0089390.1 hypothetical protein [Erwinia sp. S59]
MNSFIFPPPLSLSAQFYALKNLFRDGKGKIINHNRTLIWECDLTPGPFSRQYRVLLRYTKGSSPECIVLSPDLDELAGGKKIPHTYGLDTITDRRKLCLFLPKSRTTDGLSEWRPQLKLSDTMIPWASLWLLYFEDWLFSGEWKGGGAHPSDDENGVYFDES